MLLDDDCCWTKPVVDEEVPADCWVTRVSLRVKVLLLSIPPPPCDISMGANSTISVPMDLE